MKKVIKNQNGFTLLEIVVALAIAAIALPMLLRAFSDGTKRYSLIENRTTALYLLRLKMAEIEMNGYSALASEEGDFGTDSRFKWASEVVNTEIDGLKEVTVIVTWQERGQEKSIQLSTYMSDRTMPETQEGSNVTTTPSS